MSGILLFRLLTTFKQSPSKITSSKSRSLHSSMTFLSVVTFAIQGVYVPRNATVQHLIEVKTRSWKRDLKAKIFLEYKTEIVSHIPISMFGAPDKLSWWPARKGAFSVKSVYYLALQQVKMTSGKPSNSRARNQMWRELWKLKVPATIRCFLWRACQDILPTRLNFMRRKITDHIRREGVNCVTH